VCIERCKPGSEGGAGVSSQEASRAYPTVTGQGAEDRDRIAALATWTLDRPAESPHLRRVAVAQVVERRAWTEF
jgi:hypothetical protein